MSKVSERFPEFPWDTIAAAKSVAASHDGGIVDLSIGTPVDPTPEVARQGLIGAANSPGYPTVYGPDSLRQSAADWLTRRFEITGLTAAQILPSVGSKELIANLPLQLGLGTGDTIGIPELAYPTYEVGARLAGCDVIASDSTVGFGPITPKLVFINSPSNPTGRILGIDHLKKMVDWARERGVLLVSDECYLEYAWEDTPYSILHPDVCGGTFEGILTVHSLSKRSNLAGYRAAFVAGDQAVVDELLAVRKHLGFMIPTPVQAAMEAVLADDAHVKIQRKTYAMRRHDLRKALEGAGFTVEHSEGALYLWATRGEPCRDTIDWLAARGILAAPGDFYGAKGAQYVRVAFTATDERIAAAVERLS
ncbi:MAG: succinyldiaminopimelate transaminase [Aeromicrobium sp.]